MLVGNARAVDALMRVKSNLDSGIFQAVQQAAITALRGPQDCVGEHNSIYQRRRDRMVEVLNRIGLKVRVPKASLYIWARIPPGFTSISFASRLLDETGVVVTPGTGYGQWGEGYIRLSITVPDAQMEKGLARLAQWQSKGGI
ncbi:MAG: aminotransferase class I/II-fold pyridoxal phosphate-dependent enzyme [Dehalococcoidia bacterium]|nr:aminotransferase class I/II-fold pyridoxal phosphate-dependent enzyme [Dehalococcoidia bacterium]